MLLYQTAALLRERETKTSLVQRHSCNSEKRTRLNQNKKGPILCPHVMSTRIWTLETLATEGFRICPWDGSLCPHALTFSLSSFGYMLMNAGASLCGRSNKNTNTAIRTKKQACYAF